ncbi:FAD/NAD(P)-binding protein [Lentzea sp. JNUCC 0626]|uniref:FAD/NAD(P)-binding protein n=1 Tax=Lentzea sp. JNUCC 0626 TaxID=3367513 RepID=UPI003747BAEA
MVIVGAGLGGTATAVRLLRFAREPLQVVLVERTPEHRNAGVAYHPAGNPWHHVFNIQAGRMSMFREDVDDFVAWANTDADRTGWPAQWRDVTFTESGPAPRRIYADYLADRLAEAAREASAGVTLAEVDGEAVEVVVDAGDVHVVVENSALPRDSTTPDASLVRLRADHLIVATGLEQRAHPFAAEVLDHPSFVRQPYSAAGVESVQGVRPDAVVAIIGSLLTGYDSAALLLRRGHTGKIHMISRSGLTIRTYPPDHRHQVLDLPPPRLSGDYEGPGDLVRRVKEEWDQACALVAEKHPDVAPVVVTERVAKSWEPHLPPLLHCVPTADLRMLLDGYGSVLATLRVSAVAYTTEVVDAAMTEDGQISLATGTVTRIDATGNGTLALTVSTPDTARTVEADLVISNFGREPDYERAGSALWTNLLENGLAVRHGRTGRGVEVDETGVLLGPSGLPSGPISVVGGPREGDEIVRYGRIGAFAFNLAAIKNHSVGVAADVVRRLESCYDDDQIVDVTADPATPAFACAVSLEARRMAARRRHDREELAHHLDDSLADAREALGDNRPTTATLRFAVNTAATTKLNDLSVTPRELRSLLRLDEPATPAG